MRQAKLLAEANFHDDIGWLPDAPMLLVANEFFDALPVQQWVGDVERRVTHEGSRFVYTIDGPVREDLACREIKRFRRWHNACSTWWDRDHHRLRPFGWRTWRYVAGRPRPPLCRSSR